MDKENASISFLDRGYQFGDGVYEVIRFYNGVFFKMDEHLQRFKKSAEKIDIQFPYDLLEMEIGMIKLMKESGYKSGYVYAQITRGVSERDHVYVNKKIEPMYVAYAVQEEERPLSNMQNGISVLLHEDIRWLKCDIKSLNLLGSVLAKNKAVQVGAKEAVLYRNGMVTEGSSTNVFVVKDGILYTHNANHLILDGITKNVVIDIAKENNIKVVQEPFGLWFFKGADEAFTTSSVAEITPIIAYVEAHNESYNKKAIGSGEPGKITKFLQDKFGKIIEEG